MSEELTPKEIETLTKNVADFVDKMVLKPYPKQVVITPIVRHPTDDSMFTFYVAAGMEEGEPHIDAMASPERSYIDAMYAFLLAELATRRPPLVVHLADDELYAARLCTILWPVPKTERLYEAIKRERTTH